MTVGLQRIMDTVVAFGKMIDADGIAYFMSYRHKIRDCLKKVDAESMMEVGNWLVS